MVKRIAVLLLMLAIVPKKLSKPLEVKTIVSPKVVTTKQVTKHKKQELGVVPVQITMYTNRHTRTASGTIPKIGTIAVSRDLKKKYKYGSWVYLKGYGKFQVTDLMHNKWRKRVDIWTPSTKQAVKHGVKYSYLRQIKPPNG